MREASFRKVWLLNRSKAPAYFSKQECLERGGFCLWSGSFSDLLFGEVDLQPHFMGFPILIFCQRGRRSIICCVLLFP